MHPMPACHGHDAAMLRVALDLGHIPVWDIAQVLTWFTGLVEGA